MPSIKDLKNPPKPNKMFKKKEYRPWDENKTNDSTTEVTIEKKVQPPVSTYHTIKKEPKEKSSNNNPVNNDLEKIWRGLYGAKKTIFEIILDNIEEKNDKYVITNAITTDFLSSSSSLPSNTIKATIQQLKNSFLIENYETKPGKGGFARYKIPKEIYKYFNNKFSSNK